MNYYQDILDYLHKSGNVSLPGIGCWSICSKSSFVDESSAIHPSSVFIEFQQTLHVDFHHQLEFLAKKWELSQLEAYQVLLLFSANMVKKCSTNLSYELPQLGVINWQSGQICFESSRELEKSYNYHKITLPLSANFQKRQVELFNDDNAASTEEEFIVIRPKFYKAAAASILFMIISLISLSYIFQENKVLLPVNFDFENTEYSIKDFNRAPENDGTLKNTDKVLEDYQLEELEKEAVEEKIDYCTYILGSFKQDRNINRLQSQLQALSIDIYKEKIGGLHRIGATIDCNDRQAYKKLQAIESSLWLLD